MKKFIFIVLAFMLTFSFAEAQKKEATFTIDPTGTTLYKDIGPFYGGCYTVAWMYDAVSITGNGADTINLEVSLDGTSYTPTGTQYLYNTATVAPNTVYFDTLCYPYYRLSVTSGTTGTITGGYISTTLYFVRIN